MQQFGCAERLIGNDIVRHLYYLEYFMSSACVFEFKVDIIKFKVFEFLLLFTTF